MYGKKHNAKGSASSNDEDHGGHRTLFLANVPRPCEWNRSVRDASEDESEEKNEHRLKVIATLRNVFEASVGDVRDVRLKKLAGKRNLDGQSVWCAYVEFTEPSSLRALFDDEKSIATRKKTKKKKKKIDKIMPFELAAPEHQTGALADKEACVRLFNNHLSQYEKSPEQLMEETNRFIAAFETREEQIRLAKERKRNEVDADGFTLVSRKRQARHAVIEANRVSKKPKKKKKELKDFYRFQLRESKRDQLAELRKKFEADKRRIEKLKAARKFRPY